MWFPTLATWRCWIPLTVGAKIFCGRVSRYVGTRCLATADGVPAWVGIEYMAQAIAALSGCRSRMNGAAVNIGLLVGSRKYHCTQAYFPVGAILSIEVREVIHAENELSVYGCKLQGEGDFQACFAEANLNVFQPKDPQKFIRGEGA